MPKQKYCIGSIEYSSKKDATNAVKAFRDSLPLFKSYEKGAPEYQFMYDLLQNGDYQEIKEKNIAAFRISLDWKNARFMEAITAEEEYLDFSCLKCISPISPLTVFKKACRTAIVEQMIHFRNQHHQSNDGVWGAWHVDHYPTTFDEIVNHFYHMKGWCLDSLPEVYKLDGATRETKFKDSRIEQEFAEYHSKVAQLRLVTKADNLALPKAKNLQW